MSKMAVIGILAFMGVSLTGVMVAASTSGWGVDHPEKQPATNSSRRGYYPVVYGGYYRPYRGGSSRHIGAGVSGGGFRGGK